MSSQTIVQPLIGGALIGLAAALLLLTTGRIAGVSGILSDASLPSGKDSPWRMAFILGMIAGGVLLIVFLPRSLTPYPPIPAWRMAIAGLLVGFGTTWGGGCTSGHGICGVARLSPRSLVATAAFMATGILTVAILRRSGVPL